MPSRSASDEVGSGDTMRHPPDQSPIAFRADKRSLVGVRLGDTSLREPRNRA